MENRLENINNIRFYYFNSHRLYKLIELLVLGINTLIHDSILQKMR